MTEIKFYSNERFPRNMWLAWLILAIGLIITAVTSFYVKQDVETYARHEFESSCKAIRLKIEARLQAHARILRSGAAFFDASDDVTRQEWHMFTLRQRVEQQLPGIQGIGFSLVIPPERLAQHEEEMRSQGFPEYNIRPEDEREIYTSIIYLEPFEGRNIRAFGYDMFSEPVRRAAMEQARDTDAAALSGKVVLVQETGKDVQAGTLMYVPVYSKGIPTDTVEQRRAAIYGWSYSPYRMNDLMQGILGEWDKQKGIHLRIFDGELLSPDTLLYDSHAVSDGKQVKETKEGYESATTLNTRILSAGRIWTLSVRTDEQASSTYFMKVWLVISGGIIISILLLILTFLLLNTVSNAKQMTLQNEALHQAQQETDIALARYSDLYYLAPVGYCTISDKGIILEANLTAATLLGCPKNAMVQQPLSKFIFSEDQEIYYQHFIQSFETRCPQKCDLRMVKQDGTIFWIHLEAGIVQDEEGLSVCRIVINDIAERKQAEVAMKKIEWMLTSKPPANDIEDQGYGDISTLNKGGLISQSIDKGTLKEISTEYLNLLETSSAIYEKNGDYAYGIFCSGWCRLMDSASRKLCHTEDNAASLASGKWLCHESCWTECSKLAIESRSPVDIECKGGLHLYAVPIFSAGEVIGAINFGYGDPPRDAERLKSLADSYGLDTETLAKEADAFASRPAYIIELAKQRLLSSARLIGIMVDRKRAEDSLREQLYFSESLIETARVIILVLDTQGRIVRFNSYMEELVGYRVDEVKGKDWFGTFLKPEDCHTVKSLFQMAVDEIQTCGNVNEIIAKNGRTILVEWYDKTLKDKDDHTVGILAIGQDITDREQAEVEKKRLEAQLHQSQKMESIGRLAGGVAHDFNNMMMVILGFTEMSLDSLDTSDPLHENLTEIRNAAKRSADLTRQLLTFARKELIAPKVLDINLIVGSMLKLLGKLIGENVPIHWQQGIDLWLVKVDPSQIDQILANLCLNARDAIDGVGNVFIETCNITCDKIYCSIYPYAVPGDYVLLTVSDDGCGMEKEVLENLFEPFFTTKEFGKGTGLGLATVYGIVKQNNGFINVDSEPGKGTTFKIYLPRHMENVPQIEKQDRKEPVAHGHETILLVEDEPAILKMGKIMLESLGYKVLTADLPIKAINITKRHAGAIDLLITDVVMPAMHGRDLAQNIQTLYPAIMFMSGYTADVIARDGLIDEGIHFVQKPFSRNEIAAKVRKALQPPHIH